MREKQTSKIHTYQVIELERLVLSHETARVSLQPIDTPTRHAVPSIPKGGRKWKGKGREQTKEWVNWYTLTLLLQENRDWEYSLLIHAVELYCTVWQTAVGTTENKWCSKQINKVFST